MHKTCVHFLLTRFNVVRPFTANKPILDHDWLNRRFELFERFCFPSVAGQTNNDFYWIILFHPQTPDIFMQRLDRLCKSAPHLKVLVGKTFKGLIKERILDLGSSNELNALITTRLDNDDSICQDFVSEIQRQTHQNLSSENHSISRENPLFLDFSKGYYVAGDYLYQINSFANHFCSLAYPLTQEEKSGKQEVQTVFLMNHTLIVDQPGYKEIDDYPAWIEVIHESNSRNCLRGKFTPCSRFESSFSIDWSPSNIPEEQRKVRNVLDLPFSVKIANSAGRISYLRQINSARSYLEIGDFGWKSGIGAKRFNRKVLVSPCHVSKKPDEKSKKVFHPITGHEFFEECAAQYDSFGVVRLGESRDFDEFFKLFDKALVRSSLSTIFVFENTFPISKAASIPDYEEHKNALKETRDSRISWMGDNYKLVFALHDFFPQLNYVTMPQFSQTIAWFKDRESVKPAFDSMEAIASLTYDDFLGLQNHLNIEEDFKSILKKIDHDLNGNNDIFNALNTD
ncbi:MAG: glycosyltransferase [Cyanobacteria bacterium P01_C01_bin.89]